MRTRTILAAVAAPAIAAAALLVGTGAASAATTSPAVPTAAQLTAPRAVVATVHQTGLADTTSVSGTGTVPSDNGPVWAYDNIERVITVKAAGLGTWDVTFAEGGTYNAIANPLTGNSWHHTGLFGGTISYQVASPGTPKVSNLRATEPATMGHQAIMDALFGGSATVTGGGHYSFSYLGIPGAPGGVYTQVG